MIESVLLKLKHDFDKFKSDFRLLGTHLQRAQDRFTDANTSAEYFSVTLDRLHLGSVEGETLEAASPSSAELPSGDGSQN